MRQPMYIVQFTDDSNHLHAWFSRFTDILLYQSNDIWMTFMVIAINALVSCAQLFLLISDQQWHSSTCFLWSPYVIGGYYIFVLWFLPSILFSFFPRLNLSHRRLDVYWLSTRGVALREFRMQVWNVLHAARWKCRTQKIAQNSPSGHHRTTLSGYVFATKARIDNWKTC